MVIFDQIQERWLVKTTLQEMSRPIDDEGLSFLLRILSAIICAA